MGEEIFMTGTEIGSEVCDGEGAIGSTVCYPSLPTTPWSAALLEVSEAVVETAAFLAASVRAFLAARSASLEERCGADCRLRTATAEAAGAMPVSTLAGRSASTSSRLIGSLKRKKKKQISTRKSSEVRSKNMKTYPAVLGAPIGIRHLSGATFRGTSFKTGPPL